MQLERGPRLIELSHGTKLSYDVGGPASGAGGDHLPLLLLPSVGGGVELWAEFRRRLDREMVTIALDPRGFGRSSPEPPLPSTRALSCDALEFMDRLGVERFAVFGISFGALIAEELAIAGRERVPKLVLASATARGIDFAPRHLARGLRLAESVLLGDEPKPELAENIVAESAPPQVLAKVEASAAAHPWGRMTLLRFLAAAVRHAPGPALARMRAETLLLWGERDPLIGPRARRRLQRTLAQARVSVLAGVGHDLVLEAPQQTAAEVLAFLRSQPSEAAQAFCA